MNRSVNQARAIIGGDDVNAVGQTGLKFLDALFDTFGDGQRVFAVSHQHDATSDFVAIFFIDAAAKLRAEMHAGDIANVDRSAVDLFEDRVLDVLLAAQPADATHDIFSVVLLNHSA